MGRSGLIRLPQSAWEASLYVGVVLQLVVSLFLLTGNYAEFPAAVARDIYIVGAVALVAAVVLAMVAPLAAVHTAARRVLVGAVLVILFVSVLGAVSQAVTPWSVVPSLVLVFGALLLFRHMKSEGTEE